MHSITLLAADASAHAPGWGKLGALILTGGGFLLVMKILERIKAKKAGEIVDPFSSEAPSAPDAENPQVTPSTEAPKEAPERGPKRGFRFPWKGGK